MTTDPAELARMVLVQKQPHAATKARQIAVKLARATLALTEERDRLRDALEAIVRRHDRDSMFQLPSNCAELLAARAALRGKEGT